MSHIEYERERRRARRVRVLSHLYSLVNTALGFFCLWQFAAAMRYVIGFSTKIYWLSKSWWQQVAFLAAAFLFIAVALVGQHLYERAMLRGGRRVPGSFIVITLLEALFYTVCLLITQFYFP